MSRVTRCRRRARRTLWQWLHAKRAPHDLIVRCGSAAVRVSSSSALARYLYEGSFETTMQDYLIRGLRPGMRVLDIGANIGVYTTQFARAVGESGHVYAFEPAPQTAERLRDNIDLNRLRNVTLVTKALADREGTAEFHLFPEGEDVYN
jgi:16S rRNA C967 or C1407 C5-methylase (RsmB/RsmF family)